MNFYKLDNYGGIKPPPCPLNLVSANRKMFLEKYMC